MPLVEQLRRDCLVFQIFGHLSLLKRRRMNNGWGGVFQLSTLSPQSKLDRTGLRQLICLTFVTSLNNLLSFSQLSSVLSLSKFSAALAINCALDSFKNSQVSKDLIYFLTFNLGHQLPFLMASCHTVPGSLNKGSNAITFSYFKQIWLQPKLQGIVHTFINI